MVLDVFQSLFSGLFDASFSLTLAASGRIGLEDQRLWSMLFLALLTRGYRNRLDFPTKKGALRPPREMEMV